MSAQCPGICSSRICACPRAFLLQHLTISDRLFSSIKQLLSYGSGFNLLAPLLLWLIYGTVASLSKLHVHPLTMVIYVEQLT